MSPDFSFLVSSCRLVEHLVPYHRHGGRSWRGVSCGSTRGGGGEASFVCPAAWRGAWHHHSPVVLFASRPSVSWGVSLLVPHVLVRRWRFVLSCLPVLSNRSSRVVGRGVRSRLVVAFRLIVS